MRNILCFAVLLVGIVSWARAQVPTCAYSNLVNNEYTCQLRNAAVFPGEDEITISGEVDTGKSEDDVLHVITDAASEFIFAPIFKKFKNLKTAEFPIGVIDSLAAEYFINCDNLEKLVITASDFKTIPENVFSACTSLKQLILTGNKITTLNKESFASLENLTELRMDDNTLLSLPKNVLDPLVNLKILDLSNNANLKDFNNNAFKNNGNLEELLIADNKYVRFSKEFFEGLIKLTTLDVTNNKLNEVEKAVFDKLPLLKVAKFKSNVCIDDDFDNFQSSDIDKFQTCIANFGGDDDDDGSSSMIMLSKFLVLMIVFLKLIW